MGKILATLTVLLLISDSQGLAMAQQKTFIEHFNDAAKANPRFAVTAAYAFGPDAPEVMTAGPTVKRGVDSVPNDARWHLGSISKTFTATLVMRMVDSGDLDLDAPIAGYLAAHRDRMHQDWQDLSLRQLLSHTAGVPANAPARIAGKATGQSPYEGRRTVLSAMWNSPLNGKTGRYDYSNIGYVLAGIVVEEIIGTSWEKAIVSEVSGPLELSSLGFGAPREPDAPRGHQSIFGYMRPVPPESEHSDNPAWMGPAGTIHLNMADLVRWGQAHIQACNGNLQEFLTQRSCQLMQTAISPDYGLGWVIQTTETAGQAVWHNGSNTMWYAMLALAPEKDLVIAAATNTPAREQIDRLIKDLSQALVDEL